MIKKVLTVFVMLGLFAACQEKPKVEEKPTPKAVVTKPLKPITFRDSLTVEQEVYVIENFDNMKPLFEINDNKVHVINFWATWCGPCVRELPHFEEVYDKTKEEKLPVQFHYVSLDFKKNYKKKLFKFLEPRPFMQDNFLLIDPNSNAWINEIDPKWMGSIPITIIYKGDKKEIHKGSIKERQLMQKINSFL